MNQPRRLIAISGAVLVSAGALIALRHVRAPVASPFAGASASATPSASAPPASSQPSIPLDFSFDCAGLPPPRDACPGASPFAAKLVQSSLWTSVNGAPCGNALKAERAEVAAHALLDAQGLAHEKLPPLERALLQNAALRLLSCSVNVEKAPLRAEIAQNAKRLVQALTLDASELAALPSSARELGWLGDGSGWQVGTLRTHLHELADGYVSTVERAQHEQQFASIFRLILVDDKGELHATDVASKLLLRRPAQAAGRFSVCIATLDPASAHCNVAALQPVSTALQTSALTLGDGAPACHHCHSFNHANSLAFGPSSGLGPETVTLEEAREPLLKALSR
jgi:hypothetical protein